MHHFKTMSEDICLKLKILERLKLLREDPLADELDISVKEPETVSRFLNNFSHKQTRKFREINFEVFNKLLLKRRLNSITIDMNKSVVYTEGHQVGTTKG